MRVRVHQVHVRNGLLLISIAYHFIQSKDPANSSNKVNTKFDYVKQIRTRS